jgi:hypothetical protein
MITRRGASQWRHAMSIVVCMSMIEAMCFELIYQLTAVPRGV